VRRIALTVVVVLTALALIAPAGASAASPTPTRAQFNALQSKVTKLTNRITELETDQANQWGWILWSDCMDAQQWYLLGYDYDDQGSCAAVGQSKVSGKSTKIIVPSFLGRPAR
jgi:hypothetical protein